MKLPFLVCNQCGTKIKDADDLGFGYSGEPRVGVTHVCDRFEYGFRREPTNKELQDYGKKTRD